MPCDGIRRLTPMIADEGDGVALEKRCRTRQQSLFPAPPCHPSDPWFNSLLRFLVSGVSFRGSDRVGHRGKAVEHYSSPWIRLLQPPVPVFRPSKFIPRSRSHAISRPRIVPVEEAKRSVSRPMRGSQEEFRITGSERSRLRKGGAADRQLLAVAHVKRVGRITNADYQKLAKTTRKTSTRDLDALVAKGVFRRVGQKRGSHYVLDGRK